MSQPSVTRAMVFAAGLGKRLRPITDTLPKPLVPVGGVPMLDRALDLLATGCVEHAIVNAAWLKEQIVSHIQMRLTTQRVPGITLSLETEPLETGGGVMHAWPYLKSTPFFAMNSDVVVVPGYTHPVARLRKHWLDAADGLDALLLVVPSDRATGYEGAGDFYLNAQNVPRFRRADETTAPYVFTGLQLLHPRLFEHAPQGAFSLSHLYRRLCDAAETGHSPRIAALVHDGDWLHVGDAAGLALAEDYFRQRR